jgi:hypothetical protein
MPSGQIVAAATALIFLGLPITYVAAADTGISAACGKANALALTTAPKVKLCESGVASAVSGTGPWTWDCADAKSGARAQCKAAQVPILCAKGVDIEPCSATLTPAAAWTPPPDPFRTVFYHTVHASFWAQLADDETGASPTPRELAIASLQQNFAAIKALGFDTVTLGLPDSGGWPSGYSGGFSYDPRNPAAAQPGFAVAQEIALRIADANHLKVIFSISFDPYRFSSDGRLAWAGLADEYGLTSKPRGAYDFIHCLIEPNLYYGEQRTSKLATIGLTDGPTRSLIGDPRIIGWELSAEWNRQVVNAETGVGTQQRGFQKYWNFFSTLIHDHGAHNAFAGTYLIGSPDAVRSAYKQLENVKAFKQWFARNSGLVQPDLVGLEFYGGSEASGYDLGTLSQDLDKMIDAMETADPKINGDFPIPANKIYLGEGNANQAAQPGVNQYFQDIFQVLTDRGLAGIKFFVSDALANKTIDGKPTLVAAQPSFDLFDTTYTARGTRKFASSLPLGVVWHWGPNLGGSYADPTTYRTSETVAEASYGQWTYVRPTRQGLWIQQAIANHTDGRNLRFYANPNPAGASGPSTLHWDLSHMPNVRTVAIREGSAPEMLLARKLTVPYPSGFAITVPSSGSEKYTLIDTTGGTQGVLAVTTIEAR